MCGICGQYNFDLSQVSVSVITKMAKKIKHRGPDDDGIYINDSMGFGFVRLSIIDLTPGGHQPMQDETGRYIMVFNGEIYNYIELKEDLRSKGQNFRTNSDAEVLLKSYIAWGEDCLNKLNGMFAFAIYDNVNRKMFGARDRFGEKPFYYVLNESFFRFSSEISSLCEVTNKKYTANYQSIFDYLVFNRTDHSEDTFFSEIKKLKHGYSFTIEKSVFKTKRWYNLKNSLQEPFSTPLEYKEQLTSSIKLRLRSDVPVGVCLSGGLDSSTITSLMLNELTLNPLKTFSSVYKNGEKCDESRFLEKYKKKNTDMSFSIPTAETFYHDLVSFLNAHNEPISSTSPYAQYKLMESAKGNVGVIIDGQGADEQLAGYHYFYGILFKNLLLSGKLIELSNEIFQYWMNHKSIYGYKTFAYFLLSKDERTRIKTAEIKYLNPDFLNTYLKFSKISNNIYSSKSLNEALLDHFEYKLEHLLKWSDKNSMWFSLENRSPFLDHQLVERTLVSPYNIKIKNGSTKYILRESIKGIIPEEIRVRKDKIGFCTPEDEWFRNDKFEFLIKEIILSNSFKERDIIDPKVAWSLYLKHLDKKINISRDIWKLINLELWFRQYID